MRISFFSLFLVTMMLGCAASPNKDEVDAGVRDRVLRQSAASAKWDQEWAEGKARDEQIRQERRKRIDQEKAADKESSKLQPGESYEHYMERSHSASLGIPTVGKRKSAAHDALEDNGWNLQGTHTDNEQQIEVWNGRYGSTNEFVYITYRDGLVSHVSSSKVQ